jgi:hypothetical protein
MQAMPQLLDTCCSRNDKITFACMCFSLFASMSVPFISINLEVKMMELQCEVLMAVNIKITDL